MHQESVFRATNERTRTDHRPFQQSLSAGNEPSVSPANYPCPLYIAGVLRRDGSAGLRVLPRPQQHPSPGFQPLPHPGGQPAWDRPRLAGGGRLQPPPGLSHLLLTHRCHLQGHGSVGGKKRLSGSTFRSQDGCLVQLCRLKLSRDF